MIWIHQLILIELYIIIGTAFNELVHTLRQYSKSAAMRALGYAALRYQFSDRGVLHG